VSTQLATQQIRMQQWAQIIRAKNESGLTVKDYCENNSISENAYYYWLRKIRASAIEAAGGQFAELAVPAEPQADASGTAGVTIEMNGARLLVSDAGCRDTLTMVLEVLRYAQ